MSNTRHPISYNKAVDFILQFITKYSTASGRSFGGFINRETLETILENNSEVDLYGLLLWYCYDDTEELPYFFPSFINMDGFDKSNPPTAPTATGNFYMAQTIHAWSGPLSILSLKHYLENTDYSGSNDAATLQARDVDKLVNNYMNNFPDADDTNDYRSTACGLFIQEDTGITDLISDESCIGINYYFGITNDEEPKICLVLFPVDDTGFNATNRLILEHQFP